MCPNVASRNVSQCCFTLCPSVATRNVFQCWYTECGLLLLHVMCSGVASELVETLLIIEHATSELEVNVLVFYLFLQKLQSDIHYMLGCNSLIL